MYLDTALFEKLKKSEKTKPKPKKTHHNSSRISPATKGTTNVDIIKEICLICLHSLRLGESHQKVYFWYFSDTDRNREDFWRVYSLEIFPQQGKKNAVW